MAPRNASFEPGSYRAKFNIQTQQYKSVPVSSKKKGGGPGGQKHQFPSKFVNTDGNLSKSNLRLPPPSTNKILTAQNTFVSSALVNGGRAGSNTNAKVPTLNAPPAHFVVVERHGQNRGDHRHHVKATQK